MYRRLIKNFDYKLVGAAFALVLFSMITIGSATLEFTDASYQDLVKENFITKLIYLDYTFILRQAGWVIVGIFFAGLILSFDYEEFRKYARHLYAVNLAVLASVLFVAPSVMGAQRWIYIGPYGFQPSEFAKLIIIVIFADFLTKRKDRLNSWWGVLSCFVYMSIPILLIVKQPDLGTSLVFLAIMFGMMFAAGVRPAILLTIIGAGLVFGFSIYSVHEFLHKPDVELKAKIIDVDRAIEGNDWYLRSNQALQKEISEQGFTMSVDDLKEYRKKLEEQYLPVSASHAKFHQRTLKEYQMTRLTIFLNPESDLLGAGYHVWQSRIAIGSGGITGKGLLGGTQSHYTFLPIRQTDFIFSVVGEEFGFVGAVILLVLYLVILFRVAQVAMVARDDYGTLLAAGVVSMFAFHTILNVGMTAGVMPVTGIPLPLFSYGGSNMIMNIAALGLVLNIYIRRQKLIF